MQQSARGRTNRGGGGSGRKRNTLDLGAIEGYANRLTQHPRGTSGLAGAAPGLAGAASALAGGGLASRLTAGGTQGSDEDFRREVTEQLALIEERLQRLEEQVQGPSEQGEAGLAEPEVETGPESNI